MGSIVSLHSTAVFKCVCFTVIVSLTSSSPGPSDIGLCSFIAATNVNVAVNRYYSNIDISEWSCNTEGETNSPPCGTSGFNGWSGISCSCVYYGDNSNCDYEITVLSLPYFGLTGKYNVNMI
jgi:hypothetical protein